MGDESFIHAEMFSRVFFPRYLFRLIGSMKLFRLVSSSQRICTINMTSLYTLNSQTNYRL